MLAKIGARAATGGDVTLIFFTRTFKICFIHVYRMMIDARDVAYVAVFLQLHPATPLKAVPNRPYKRDPFLIQE